MDGRRGRRRKELLDDLKETEAPDRALWMTRFGRGCGGCRKTDYVVINTASEYLYLCAVGGIISCCLPERNRYTVICL